jgi:NAD(P)H-dependent flavin oxidoreductase YrpB (nitropropane dioxygenase family)
VPSLVSAVSNAGGLGRVTVSGLLHASLTCATGILTALTQPNPDALRDAIRETRRKTDKPFGVNITLLPTINPPDYEGFARAAVAEGVRVFETAGNNRS